MHALPATRDALGRGAPTPAQQRRDRRGSLATPSAVSYARKPRPRRPKKTAPVDVEPKSSAEAPRDSYRADASVNIASTHTHPMSHRTAQRPDDALLSGVRSSLSSLSPPTMPAVATTASPTTFSPLKRRHDSDVNYSYKNARARHHVEPQNVSSPHFADTDYDLSAAERMRRVHPGRVSPSAVTNSALDYRTTPYLVNQPVPAEMTRQYTQEPPLAGYEVFERPAGSDVNGEFQTFILEQRNAERRGYDGERFALSLSIPGVAFQEMVARDKEPALTLQTTNSQSPNFVGDDPIQFAPYHSPELQHAYARVEHDASYVPPHMAATEYQICSNMMCGGTAPHRAGFASTASPEPTKAIDTTPYELDEVVNTGYSFTVPAPASIQLPVYQRQDWILPSTGRPPSPQQLGRTPIAPDPSQTTAYWQASDDNLDGGLSQPGQVSVHDAGFGDSELHARLALDHTSSNKPFTLYYPGVDEDMCAVLGHLQQEGGLYSGDGDTFPSQRDTSYPHWQYLTKTRVYSQSALWSSPVAPHAHLSGESVPLQFPIPTTPTYDFPVVYGHHPSVPTGLHGLVLAYESPSWPPAVVHGMPQPVQNHYDDIALHRRAVDHGGSVTMCPAPPEIVQDVAASYILERDYHDLQLANRDYHDPDSRIPYDVSCGTHVKSPDAFPSHPVSLSDDYWRGSLISAVDRSEAPLDLIINLYSFHTPVLPVSVSQHTYSDPIESLTYPL
ncbi:uncharacterized protein TRAVEDRAFT_47619 [Trametes versicolor FP-101664 SS1]|uniref:uncharacterized protein n=1 Tax=Trametes versicolor (strain FP-101664) TaxID=717944 RepID=UPI000462183C|nr:uncharacterized protein TRAVEDRAFT_47619 [Trametes versicolor FP-101664 SS1]EIW58469.1 hypothetical protein TRAVEDRAFT_47619 [Trametes versicolor FP-101664 SS1]